MDPQRPHVDAAARVYDSWSIVVVVPLSYGSAAVSWGGVCGRCDVLPLTVAQLLLSVLLNARS